MTGVAETPRSEEDGEMEDQKHLGEAALALVLQGIESRAAVADAALRSALRRGAETIDLA